jgi:hypothetical protein
MIHKQPFSLLAATLIAFVAGCATLPPAGPVGTIDGKIVEEKARVSGAEVTATAELGVWGRERRHRAVTDRDGLFRLVLPPGQYFLSFRSPDGLTGFFGGNPISVREGATSKVVIRGLRWAGRSEQEPGEPGIGGMARQGNRPLGEGVVQVFLDSSSNFKGPGFAMATIGADGAFFLPLEPGTYYLVARQRQGAGRMGPLKAGDRYAWYPGNPVTVEPGMRTLVDLPFLGVERDPGQVLAEASGGIIVSGRVTRGDRGVAGLFACLYRTPEPLGMPAYVSDPTGSDGAFDIRVTEPGTYYLIARGSIGKPLAGGEYVAFARGPGGHRVEVGGRDLGGLSIPWER